MMNAKSMRSSLTAVMAAVLAGSAPGPACCAALGKAASVPQRVGALPAGIGPGVLSPVRPANGASFTPLPSARVSLSMPVPAAAQQTLRAVPGAARATEDSGGPESAPPSISVKGSESAVNPVQTAGVAAHDERQDDVREIINKSALVRWDTLKVVWSDSDPGGAPVVEMGDAAGNTVTVAYFPAQGMLAMMISSSESAEPPAVVPVNGVVLRRFPELLPVARNMRIALLALRGGVEHGPRIDALLKYADAALAGDISGGGGAPERGQGVGS